jgi:hypothetical protein
MPPCPLWFVQKVEENSGRLLRAKLESAQRRAIFLFPPFGAAIASPCLGGSPAAMLPVWLVADAVEVWAGQERIATPCCALGQAPDGDRAFAPHRYSSQLLNLTRRREKNQIQLRPTLPEVEVRSLAAYELAGGVR